MDTCEFLQFATSYWESDALAWLNNIERTNAPIIEAIKVMTNKKDAIATLIKLIVADFSGQVYEETDDFERKLFKM